MEHFRLYSSLVGFNTTDLYTYLIACNKKRSVSLNDTTTISHKEDLRSRDEHFVLSPYYLRDKCRHKSHNGCTHGPISRGSSFSPNFQLWGLYLDREILSKRLISLETTKCSCRGQQRSHFFVHSAITALDMNRTSQVSQIMSVMSMAYFTG